jgi:serine/threonine protein kinase
MSPLSDSALERLRRAVGEPDLSGTRYELRDILGRGGMATVYRAWDTTLEREVALKILDFESAGDELGRRLLSEARVLARLEHPGIVPVHDVGTLADGRVYCAMKRVEGRRLDQAMPGSELPERLRLLLKVCEAVAFAHANGVVHRDLKPQNVMLGSFGELLVVDWGLASSSRQPERDGWVVGTPGYMAPEQRAGRSGEVDARSDVYALGALLHYLIAGEPPTDGGLALPSRTPRALAAICRRALAAEPAQRYAGAADFAADLERFIDGRAVLAHRESVFERFARLFARYQTPILLIVAYLLMRALILLFARR